MPTEKKTIYFFLKRILDILGGLAGTLFFFLALLPIAIALKLDSPGPIFFFQTRLGKYGRPFKFIKFRTMHEDAFKKQGELEAFNETGGLTFKMKHDPRVTRVGALLRITSLDELPQFWLVLRGRMSLVGPRPPLIGEVERYTESQKVRMIVPQGMTGLWQVAGRSNTKFTDMTDLDAYYALNCNLWLDIKILILTFPTVLFGRGAR